MQNVLYIDYVPLLIAITHFVDYTFPAKSLDEFLGGGDREVLGVVAHSPPPAVKVTGPWHRMPENQKGTHILLWGKFCLWATHWNIINSVYFITYDI